MRSIFTNQTNQGFNLFLFWMNICSILRLGQEFTPTDVDSTVKNYLQIVEITRILYSIQYIVVPATHDTI